MTYDLTLSSFIRYPRYMSKTAREVRFILSSLILSSIFYLLTSAPTSASGISLSPFFQEINLASTTAAEPIARFSYTNTASASAQLTFSLAKTMATDVLGRFQFNAPLPQTIYPSDSGIAKIEPEGLLLNPGETATISATFDPSKLRTGTNSFLLLAQIKSPNEPPNNPTISQSNASLNQYLAATIFLTVKQGSTINLKLINVDWSNIPIRFSLPDYFILTLKNEGNTLATPRGIIRLTNMFGQEISRGPINEKSSILLPTARRVIYGTTTKTRNPFPISWLKLQINVYDTTHQSPLAFTRSFLYINPWMGVALPVLVGIGLLFRRFKTHS